MLRKGGEVSCNITKLSVRLVRRSFNAGEAFRFGSVVSPTAGAINLDFIQNEFWSQ